MFNSFIENYLAVIIASAAPFSELRGGIPLGLGLGLDIVTVILTAVIANCLMFFPVYFGLRFFYKRILYKWEFFHRLVERVRKKGKPYVDKYGILGICIFIAVPLPVTGLWTGTLLAWLLGLDWKRSFLAAAFGVIIAGAIVSAVSLGFLSGVSLLA